jgi:hypothetical protein
VTMNTTHSMYIQVYNPSYKPVLIALPPSHVASDVNFDMVYDREVCMQSLTRCICVVVCVCYSANVD